uniref:Macro domain-containing protein n=1 Tax=Laticauda laticaudata TaxID=8630 RepID=A0A8C5S5U0_LATLA
MSQEIRIPMDEEMLSIPISNSIYAVLKRRENYLCSLLQKKFGCICVLKSIRNPMEVYRKSLKEGVEVSVWVDDFTRHEADALVNAANEYLHHFGGLAFALLKAGGPEIEEQCKLFVEKNGPLSPGQIVVTSGGRLPCKQIIHAVENNIKSVAIPALSSGIFNFPQDWCAQVIVQTIRNFVQLAPLFGYLQEIHLVNIDETTADVMKRACEDLIGINDIVPQLDITDSIRVNELSLQIKKGNIETQQVSLVDYVSCKPHNPRKLVADTREKCEMDHLICVFEAEVVTGLYTRGNRSYVAPPLINTSSMKLYDSVVDDIHNPEIFVVFNKEQALPLEKGFIFTYQ